MWRFPTSSTVSLNGGVTCKKTGDGMMVGMDLLPNITEMWSRPQMHQIPTSWLMARVMFADVRWFTLPIKPYMLYIYIYVIYIYMYICLHICTIYIYT